MLCKRAVVHVRDRPTEAQPVDARPASDLLRSLTDEEELLAVVRTISLRFENAMSGKARQGVSSTAHFKHHDSVTATETITFEIARGSGAIGVKSFGLL